MLLTKPLTAVFWLGLSSPGLHPWAELYPIPTLCSDLGPPACLLAHITLPHPAPLVSFLSMLTELNIPPGRALRPQAKGRHIHLRLLHLHLPGPPSPWSSILRATWPSLSKFRAAQPNREETVESTPAPPALPCPGSQGSMFLILPSIHPLLGFFFLTFRPLYSRHRTLTLHFLPSIYTLFRFPVLLVLWLTLSFSSQS